MPRRDDDAAAWRLVLALALVCVAFNVKMLAAFGVLAVFAVSYFLTARASPRAADPSPRRPPSCRCELLVSSFLTPDMDRPYVDSTSDNSIFDLVVNHNALQRFIPRARTGGGPVTAPRHDADQLGAPGRGRLAAGATPPGPARLIDPRLARQAAWLLPLALAGAAGMIAARKREAACAWIGWLAAYWLAFSFAGGLFAPYYLVMLAPPLAALSAVGVVTLPHWWRQANWRRWLCLAHCPGFERGVGSPYPVARKWPEPAA